MHPENPPGAWYVVAPGETLEQIASARRRPARGHPGDQRACARQRRAAGQDDLRARRAWADLLATRAAAVARQRLRPRALRLRPRPSAAVAGERGRRAGPGRFRWPIDRAAVGSPFGTREGRPHEGIDLPAPIGTPVYAAADGQVVYAGNGIRGYGNLIVLQARGRSADRVRAQLGAAGRTGASTVRGGAAHRAGRARAATPPAPTCTSRSDGADSPGSRHIFRRSLLRPEARREQPTIPTRARTLLRARVRDIPDFPKPGILFRDLTPLMGDGPAMRTAHRAAGRADRAATAPELIVADRVARLHLRRAGGGGAGRSASRPCASRASCPGARPRGRYDLEYGTDSLEMHADAVVQGARVVIVDDLLATGGHGGGDRRAGARAGRPGRRVGVRRRAGAAARARAPGRPCPSTR